jgi:SAM-dependent methyltransferase
LAEKAARVVGLDISNHALGYANGHHHRSNIEYRQADFNLPIPLPSSMFDAIVSFETLEHVDNQEQLIAEFHRLLRVGGMLILSSPDRIVTERLHHRNKFHVRELSQLELMALVGKYFAVRELYGQLPYSAAFWKRPLMWVARLDVLNLRARIGDTGLKNALGFLRGVSVSSTSGNIVRIAPQDRRLHLYIVMLAAKVR